MAQNLVYDATVDSFHVGAVGAILTIICKDSANVAIDISGATDKRILLMNPVSQVVTIKTAAFVSDGKDGALKYTFVAGDLSDYGTWKAQAYVVLSSATFFADVVEFKVLQNLGTIPVVTP